MDPSILLKIFAYVVLVFAFSIHECAHAWVAWRLGDPTARMLGRITLNRIKHMDPWGSVAMPMIAMLMGGLPLIGWAKPTPVTSRNFKNFKRDDILVTLAGPASNLLVAAACLLLLLLLKHSSQEGAASVFIVLMGGLSPEQSTSALFPFAVLLYMGILVNLAMLIFNLIPIPPLDGSRVLLHFLPYNAARHYEKIGYFGFILIFIIGGYIIGALLPPALGLFRSVLAAM